MPGEATRTGDRPHRPLTPRQAASAARRRDKTRTDRAPVVTGVGAITPLGPDAAALWSGLLAGRSGVRHLTEDWATELSVRIAATAPDPDQWLDRKTNRTLDRSQRFALVAAREAWADAGSPVVDPLRLAVVIGSGVGGILTLLHQYEILRTAGERRVSPHSVPMLMPNGPAVAVGIDLNAQAGVHTPVSACASGAEAVAVGSDLIRDGRADVVVCGGTEAAVHAVTVAGFAAMRSLSTRHTPEDASRPFDRDRDGFVLGEGAGVVVLESARHAAARGKHPYATLVGTGRSADSHHIVAPEPNGRGAARAVTAALRTGRLTPRDVVHINAHATSTPIGDVAESRGLRTALGSALDEVPVTATKSMTGHLLGAAGAVEAVATILSLNKRQAPAIRNLQNVDDHIELDLVRNEPRRLRDGAALSTSFGFGGHNVALAFAPVTT